MTFWIPESDRPRYRPLAGQGLEGWIEAELFEAMDDAQRRAPLDLLRLPAAERVKDSRNALARAAIGSGARRRIIWIKHFRPRGPVAWLQHAFRSGKAERAWNTAFAMLEEAVPTPRPLLGMTGRGWSGGARGLLVVEDAGQTTPLRQWLRDLKPGTMERARLIEGLASFVSHMHSKGFCHRDLSGGNILVREEEGNRFVFTLVDINRMRRFPALSEHRRLRDLERIRLADADVETFFSAYSAGFLDTARLREAYLARALRYQRMRSTHSLWERLALKARYYWDEMRG